MNKISVKMSDISLRGTEGAKSLGQTREVTDDFKKLLQGQKDDDSVDVSKDTKTEKKPEDVKEEEPIKTDNAKEDAAVEEKVQTEGLLAAYQMTQNFRPEMIQVENETLAGEVISEEEPVIAETEFVPQMTEQTGELQAAESLQVQQVQSEKPDSEVKLQAEKPVEATEPEVKVSEAPVQQVDTSEEQKGMAQSDSHQAEQAVQVQNPEVSVKTEAADIKHQEPVRMQVPQPEELPDKVTDQLMAKMSEGIQEFEIHIEPVNLGKIAVKILYQDGQATVSVMCSEKKAFDILERNAGEIGQIIDKNLGGTTTIVVDKQESDYLNQTKDENQQNGQNGEKEQSKEGKKEQSTDDAQDFLQKLRLGLTG